MSEDRKCPKYGGELEKGKRLYSYDGVLPTKKSDLFGDKIILYHCKSCGYIEL